MPCKLSSQVKTCLFICDSLLSSVNKSKRGNYLGRSVSLIALKHNLLGHERKHRCSRTPVKLHITTSWRRRQQWHCTSLEGAGKQHTCCPGCAADPVQVHPEWFPPWCCICACSAESRFLPQACTRCLSPSSPLPAEWRKGTGCTEVGALGTCFSSPSQQEVQKKNSQRDTRFLTGCCTFWIRRMTIWVRLSF